ncbi:MAG TPA: VOC family protein [Candidatus Dormibacteraeota bacterium]|nr:VOC family protein [Candidatus Dormibacteraeota bacterium]
MPTRIFPFLTVRGAAAAIDYYKRAFNAEERSRIKTPSGQIVAELSIEDARFNVVDENPEELGALEQASSQDLNLSPQALGGTSVRIDLVVDDPDAVARQAIAAGGKELFPVGDQPYGWRQGRVVDPFGHHWLIGKPLN